MQLFACGHERIFYFIAMQDRYLRLEETLFQETSIEMVIIDNDGIVQSISEQPVFGIIKDLAVLPWNKRFQAQSPKVYLCYLFLLNSYLGTVHDQGLSPLIIL